MISRWRRRRDEPSADEALLLDSVLFDERWYARVAGVPGLDRREAVRHYLAEGVERGLSPHPLVDLDHLRRQLGPGQRERLGDGDPLTFYLRRRIHGAGTHPLFDAAGYLHRVPEAGDHPGGPTGHYCEVGAAAGVPANDWLDGDLREWVVARHDEWEARRQAQPRAWRRRYDNDAAAREVDRLRSTRPATAPSVTVVLDAGAREELLGATLDSLAAQTRPPHQTVVVDRGHLPDLAGRLASAVGEHVLVGVGAEGAGEALARALGSATGDCVAFLTAGDTWEPWRLEVLAAALADGTAVVCDDVAATAPDGAPRYAVDVPGPAAAPSRVGLEPARVAVRREALPTVDRALAGQWGFDLGWQLARRPVRHVPVLGVRRHVGDPAEALIPAGQGSPSVPHEVLPSWRDVVINNRHVDWAALAGRTPDDRVVSVVIPTFDDHAMTTAAVESVMAADHPGVDVEVLVWDNGSSAAVSAVLDALPVRFPRVTVLHCPDNLGFALGNNLALPHARGGTVVFLNNDVEVPAGWLPPLLAALAEPGVLGAQPLLVYPTGAVQSAGVAFPTCGGLPHQLLQGYPVEDARRLGDQPFAALTGAALAVRFADAVALRGFDPVFTNGMEDVDLCRRLAQARSGHFRVVPDEPVVHHESRSRGRYARFRTNREVYLERWAGQPEPADDERLWAAAGYRVVGHQSQPVGPARRKRPPGDVFGDGPSDARRIAVPEPVVVRESRLAATTSPRPLRWAIKNAAPSGPLGETWGDTHFARAVADALRGCGEDVVVDHRPEWERESGWHDDVVLLLRGRVALSPPPEQVSIAWVISHPDRVAPAELVGYDHVFAAGAPWARRVSAEWGIAVEPLLQATDPARFAPDAGADTGSDAGHRLLFVGNSRGEYRRVVRDAVEAGLPIDVYGREWDRFLGPGRVVAEHLPNAELGAAYARAGIVLNDHWDDMRREGFLSNRLFDAVASGARVVTDPVAGLDDEYAGLFGAGVRAYRDPAELARLAGLLERPAELDAVFGDAAARLEAAERIRSEHSFASRAARLVEVAREVRARRGLT